MSLAMVVGEARAIVIEGLVGATEVEIPQTRVITVSSNNKAVATVEYGYAQYPPDDAAEVSFLVRAQSVGTATITATFKPGATTFTGTLLVTVTAVPGATPPTTPAPAAPAGLTGIQIETV